MDVIFNCTHCDQELSVDAAGAGTVIDCPSCGGKLVIPQPGAQEHRPVNPIATSAAAHHKARAISRRFQMLQIVIVPADVEIDFVFFEKRSPHTLQHAVVTVIAIAEHHVMRAADHPGFSRLRLLRR